MRVARGIGYFLAEHNLRNISKERFLLRKPGVRNRRYKEMLMQLGLLRRFVLFAYPQYSEIFDDEINRAINEAVEEREFQISMSYKPLHARHTTGAVINLSSSYLPEDIALLLSFGPKFIIAPSIKTDKIFYFLDTLETVLDLHFSPATFTTIQNYISKLIKKHVKYSLSTEQIWLRFLLHRTKSFIRNNPNVYITNSDKGKHTVLIDKELYIEKGNSLVLTKDYIHLPDFDLNSILNKNNELVSLLLSRGILKQKYPYYLRSAVPAKFYVLIKIHKPGYPPRPIFSACGSVGYTLSKFMLNILQSVFVEKGYHVKNSLESKEKLKGIRIENDEELVSFDAKSMFTSITIDLVLDIILSKANQINENFGISCELLREIFIFLLKDCAIFQWQDEYYKQANSLAMGSCLSPILANMVVTRLLNVTIPKLITPPKMLHIYVDDSFTIIKRDSVGQMLEALNNFHPSLQFEVEREKEGSICFLDIRVFRAGNEVITNWYRKPFSSYRLLNFLSGHKKGTIINVAVTFIKKCLLLSDPEFFQMNKEIIRQILVENCFPLTLIIRILQENYTLMKPPMFRDKQDKIPSIYTALPHIDGFTYRIKYLLQSLNPNLTITHSPFPSPIRIFSSVKDKTDPFSKTNTIVLFGCDCLDKIIIRHTQYEQNVHDLFNDCKFERGRNKCSPRSHFFHRFKLIPCNFGYKRMMNIYRYLTFIHSDRLYLTEKCLLFPGIHDILTTIKNCGGLMIPFRLK